MNFLFSVDQKAALLAGVDAPSSTVTLQVVPASLSEDQRSVLADVVVDGHDCTRKAYRCDETGLSIAKLVLIRPDLDGLRDALSIALDKKKKAAADYAPVKASLVDSAHQRIVDFLSNEEMVEHVVSVNARGEIGSTSYGSVASCTFFCYDRTGIAMSDATDESLIALYERYYRLRQDKFAEARDEAAQMLLKGPYQEWLVAEKAGKEAEAALRARLPQGLRDRIEAGFANEDEVTEALLALARSDAGYPVESMCFKGSESCDYCSCEYLDDAQFAAFLEIQKQAPEVATVDAVTVWDTDGFYRDAVADDDPEDVDSDGEVYVPRKNERVVALVKWRVGNLPVKVCIPLPPGSTD